MTKLDVHCYVVDGPILAEYHSGVIRNDEILSFFEQEFRFFEEILDEIKPHFVIMRIPDFHHIHLFHELCRKKGIKILEYLVTEIDEIGEKAVIEKYQK